jgi:CheY-like chemotaxis protein
VNVNGPDVLVIDDDAGSRGALSQLLRDEGYDVVAVTHGAEALEYLQRHVPRLIILDLMMPILDGWDFRERQRRDPAIARIPVIAVSASLRIVDADAFFLKPIRFEKLLERVREYVRPARPA